MKSLIFRISWAVFFMGAFAFAKEPEVSEVFDKTTTLGDDTTEELLHRDPFWPVGYVPRSKRVTKKKNVDFDKQKKETEQPKISLRESGPALEKLFQDQLNIDGFVQGTEGLLVFIGGKVVGLGDQLTVKNGEKVYRLEICFLSKDSIRFKLLKNDDVPQN